MKTNINKPEIKSTVNPDILPPESDFWIAGKSTLLVTKIFAFKKDIEVLINSNFGFDEKSVQIIDLKRKNDEKCIIERTYWARDMIATKSETKVYKVVNVSQIPKTFNREQITQNAHLSPYHNSGENSYYTNDMKEDFYEQSQVIAAGGNIFHCVNARGEPCSIVGEGAVSSIANTKNEARAKDSETGKKSFNKYSGQFFGKEEVVKQRQLNKQLIQEQLSSNTTVVVVPNIWSHIDLSMTALPNGVVLLHSFRKTLNLLEKQVKEGSLSQEDYEQRVKYTKEFIEKAQPLLDETKRKLEKRGFIVQEVCGVLTKDNTLNTVQALGMNGLSFVTKEGVLGYTLPPNPDWYQVYFEGQLKKAGITIIHPIKSISLDMMRRNLGFIRCQTNTIPSQLLNPKLDEDESPKPVL